MKRTRMTEQAATKRTLLLLVLIYYLLFYVVWLLAISSASADAYQIGIGGCVIDNNQHKQNNSCVLIDHYIVLICRKRPNLSHTWNYNLFYLFFYIFFCFSFPLLFLVCYDDCDVRQRTDRSPPFNTVCSNNDASKNAKEVTITRWQLPTPCNNTTSKMSLISNLPHFPCSSSKIPTAPPLPATLV